MRQARQRKGRARPSPKEAKKVQRKVDEHELGFKLFMENLLCSPSKRRRPSPSLDVLSFLRYRSEQNARGTCKEITSASFQQLRQTQDRATDYIPASRILPLLLRRPNLPFLDHQTENPSHCQLGRFLPEPRPLPSKMQAMMLQEGKLQGRSRRRRR